MGCLREHKKSQFPAYGFSRTTSGSPRTTWSCWLVDSPSVGVDQLNPDNSALQKGTKGCCVGKFCRSVLVGTKEDEMEWKVERMRWSKPPKRRKKKLCPPTQKIFTGFDGPIRVLCVKDHIGIFALRTLLHPIITSISWFHPDSLFGNGGDVETSSLLDMDERLWHYYSRVCSCLLSIILGECDR